MDKLSLLDRFRKERLEREWGDRYEQDAKDEASAAQDQDGFARGERQEQEEWEREQETGVFPCFMPCGQAACRKLGCVRVYNARHAND